MRNYNDQVEAADLESRRHDEIMREREREMSAHEDRRNPYTSNDNPASNQRDEMHPNDRWNAEERNNNRGKGPKNYVRSDSRIRELVCDVFCDDPYLDASNIDVDVKGAIVFLSGSVDNQFSRRLAEELAQSISGVLRVQNRVRTDDDKGLQNDGEEIDYAVV